MVALDMAGGLDHRAEQVPRAIPPFVPDFDESGARPRFVVRERQVADAPLRRRLPADPDRLAHPDRPSGAHDRSGIPSGLAGPRLEDVPVGDDHLAGRQGAHGLRRDEVPSPVETGLSPFRLQFLEPVADRHIGADDQHEVRVPGVPPVRGLVQDAPGGQHRHHRGLPGAGGHLAGVATERGHAARPRFLVRLVRGNGDSLEEVGARFGEEDDGLGGFQLGEEQSLPPVASAPVPHEVHRRAGNPALAPERERAPFVEPAADPRNQEQFDGRARAVGVGAVLSRFPVPVHRQASAGDPLRGRQLGDAPVLRRRLVRRVEDGLRDFAGGHGATPNARQMASSFSVTSGWISSGRMRAAIS